MSNTHWVYYDKRPAILYDQRWYKLNNIESNTLDILYQIIFELCDDYNHDTLHGVSRVYSMDTIQWIS